ncbi:MAG: DEAD/DEAH box helicase [Polyangiaceae bacterium]|nr:DEAD/DEAH box helicase [Polyangiaceae bacterium]
MTDETSLSPGSRVRIRGEEWAVQKALPLPMGGYAVHVQGVSELVRHHQAIFLTPLEKEILPLRPEDTRLVLDDSPQHRQTLLYLETLLRRTPPTHGNVTVGHRGALDVMPYQLVPAQKALSSLRPRILLADGTGLGKTVELGIVLSELIKRGRGRRILVVAIRSMLAQLQRELWARFTLPLVRLDSEGLARVQGKIPANRNPFSYFDRCIVSMDTLKNQGMYRAWLEQIRWDAIVVDECHNVANQGSQRGELARLLAAQCDALILTSATPHNGRPESFANLMRMLDPTSVADVRSFTKADIDGLVVRRFKKDVERDAGSQLKDRDVATLAATASVEDEAALEALHALELHTVRARSVRSDALIRWTLVKAFLSSHEACLESLEHRLGVTERALAGDLPAARKAVLQGDLERLVAAKALVERAQARGSQKLERLLAELRALAVGPKKHSLRVVVFSERIRTLTTIREALLSELGLPEAAIGVYTASTGGAGLGAAAKDERAQRELVESFGHEESPLRVLLCSDAASEGVNLHHQCHHLYHYDVPWSLIRLTQRNGRIDRFGQRETPHLRYLVTTSAKTTADQHVTARLIDKEREVERQLGDPGALLGLYDAEVEEDFLLRGVAKGAPVEELLPDQPREARAAGVRLAALREGDDDPAQVAPPPGDEDEAPEIDLLALLAEVEREQSQIVGLDSLVQAAPSLFPDDYSLLVAALRHLEHNHVVGPEPLQWQHDDRDQTVTLHAPEPFRRHREVFLPEEAVPKRGEAYRLVMGRELVATKLRTALDEEGRWPDWHLLWEQHPLVEWLFDALGSAYARGEAPLVRVPALPKQEAVFLLQGFVHNHESEAVEARWMGLVAQGNKLEPNTLELDEVMAKVGLAKGLVNHGKPSERKAALQAFVPAVIEEARARLLKDRAQHIKDSVAQRVRKETRRLEAWAKDSLAEITRREGAWSKTGRKPPPHIASKLQREREHVAKVQANHQQLLKSLTAHGAPYLRLAAVFAGD